MKDNRNPGADNPVARAYLQCRDALVRSVMKMSVKPEDVEDILHETYLRAHIASQKKTIQSPKDYLFVVSRNLVIRGVTKRSRELRTVIDNAIRDVSDSSLDAELHQKQKVQALDEVLGTLPDKVRQAILLRKVYGFSSREIAKKMRVSKSSVDKYIATGINKCELMLSSRGYDMDGKHGKKLSLESDKTERSRE